MNLWRHSLYGRSILTNESGCFKFLFYLRKWKKSQTHDRKALAPGSILGITVVMAHQSLQSHGHQELLENDKKKNDSSYELDGS